MVIDLTKILKETDKTITVPCKLDFNEIDNGQSSYQLLSPDEIELSIRNDGGNRLKISSEIKAELMIPCDRCLTPVPTKIDVSIDDEYRIRNGEIIFEEETDMDEISLIENNSLDVDSFAREWILLSWPTKVLCRDDCKGLCPVCGQNLNERDCGCNREIPDPRNQMFRDVLEKIKEV